MAGMIVATEICPETGSWLGEYELSAQEVIGVKELDRLISERVVLKPGSRLSGSLRHSVGGKFARFILRRKSAIEGGVSYRLHTNRELRMMLDGEKDFAVFSCHLSEANDLDFSGQKFSKFRDVVGCRIERAGDAVLTFFFLANAKWKVDAYLVLYDCIRTLGACRQTEYVEGLLLGYTHEQNMEYLGRFWPI